MGCHLNGRAQMKPLLALRKGRQTPDMITGDLPNASLEGMTRVQVSLSAQKAQYAHRPVTAEVSRNKINAINLMVELTGSEPATNVNSRSTSNAGPFTG